MLIILYCLIFTWPAWAFPLIATFISLRRGLVAHHQRRAGVYLALPTYKQELQRWDNKWNSFCDTLLGSLILATFYGVMIMGAILYADSFGRP